MKIRSLVAGILSAFLRKPKSIGIEPMEVASIVENEEQEEQDCYEIVAQEDGTGKLRRISAERLREISKKTDWTWLDGVRTTEDDPRIGSMDEPKWKAEIEKAKNESPD